MGHVHLVFTTALAFSLILVVWQQSSSAYTALCSLSVTHLTKCDMLSAASQEEEEALARALAERPDEDMDMANGDDDYPDEADEVRAHVRTQVAVHWLQPVFATPWAVWHFDWPGVAHGTQFDCRSRTGRLKHSSLHLHPPPRRSPGLSAAAMCLYLGHAVPTNLPASTQAELWPIYSVCAYQPNSRQHNQRWLGLASPGHRPGS